MLYIPAPLDDARFRKSDRFIIKAHFFINGHSLKKKCNEEYDLLSLPQEAGLETLYAALLISTIEQLLSSINALPKGVSNSS
ncbi:hypothetical protein CXF79_17725 [Colwellia sp. Bg11-28]|nr:hypothetical protein CXF79_17725 [Colwellia sp. Bg11-28]